MLYVIITGMAAGGKTTVLTTLEDAGFYCVDNMPPSLAGGLEEAIRGMKFPVESAAFGIDSRSCNVHDLEGAVRTLKERGHEVQVLFLDASNEELVKRFKENRRRHPISTLNIEEAVETERRLLAPWKELADTVLDTTGIGIPKTKKLIKKMYVKQEEFKNLVIHVQSFGFKYGMPPASDIVYDVRFLPNPFYIPELRPMTGNDKPVSDYVLKYEVTQKFLEKMEDMLLFLIPHYIKEGKSQLVLGIGCTGGQHRSVTIANELSRFLQESGYEVYLRHREIAAHHV